MIIGGKYRTNGKQLGEYLGDYLQHEKNDRVETIEIRGSGLRGLTPSIATWEAEAKGSKCKNPLWHAHLRTPHGETLTREQQVAAADILERHLGFQGQPRAIVIHEKEGHEHIHVVWSRIRRHDETIEVRSRVGKRDKTAEVDDRSIKVGTRLMRAGTAKDVSFTKMKNTAAAREIEERFGLQKVESPDFEKTGERRTDREESKKAANQKDYQKAKRSKLDPIERARTITTLWEQTDSGKALQSALLQAGYVLARGDSRSFVVVDKAGDVHSLARQIKIKGVLKAQVDARLSDLDPASVPRAKHVQLDMWRARMEREAEASGAPLHAASPRKHEGSAQPKKTPQDNNAGKIEKSDGFGEQIDPKSLDPVIILSALTKQHSTFTRTELHREIDKRLNKREDDPDPKDVARIANAVGNHADFISLGEDHAGRRRYTSRAMLETELKMRASCDAMAGRNRHWILDEIRDAAPSAAKLGTEQRRAFEHVTSPAALSLVIGYAGTGKSFALGAAREAWEAGGYRVRGAALAGIAAQSLQQGSGIESRTLQSLFYQLDTIADQEKKLADMDAQIDAVLPNTQQQRYARAIMKNNRDRFAARMDKAHLTNRDIIVLDEAGMIGSVQMEKLLSAAQKAGAKVVMVGDAEQLQAIDAGGAFRALYDRHGAVKITEVRRQQAEWQKAATRDFGDGFAPEALSTYKEKGHIHQITETIDVTRKVIDDWTASRRVNPEDTHIILAYTKADVAALNQHAREAFDKEKRLGVEDQVKTATGTKAFAQGDRLFFLENRRLRAATGNEDVPVMNGSLGTVESIHRIDGQEDRHRMRVKLDTGKTVEFDSDQYTKFDHGYAATIHKSQGVTAGRAFVLASQYMDRHAAGVSMTRHVHQADMYYAAGEFENFDKLLGRLSRDGRKDTTLDYLHRAEVAGRPERFWTRVNKVVKAMTKEDLRKQALDRLAEQIRLRKDPQARAEATARAAATAQAAKLRDILSDYGDNPRKKDRSSGPSL